MTLIPILKDKAPRWLAMSALAACVALAPALAGARHYAPAMLSFDEAVSAVGSSADRLADIERDIRRRCGDACRYEVRALSRVRGQLTRAEDALEAAPIGRGGAPVVDDRFGNVYVAPHEMSPRDFAAFAKRVEDAYYNSEKLELLKHQVHFSFFTSGQVKQLLDPLYYSSTKLDALTILAPRIVDPERSMTIYDTFTYASSKAKARGIIEQAFGLGT